MRCKACDCKLAEHDMYIREETGDFEDLCVVCRKAGQSDDDDIEKELDLAFLESIKDMGWND